MSLRAEYFSEYRSWAQAKSRCYNPHHARYKDYGGRGIRMSEAWRGSFAAFLRDMGPRPDGKQLERKNNDGPYSKANCAWATRSEQSSNTRVQQRTHCLNGHRWTKVNSYFSKGIRYCRECRRLGTLRRAA